MTVVDAKTFWNVAFNNDEAKGLTVRVGAFRCAPFNDKWICLRDWAEGPYSEPFASRQEAVDFMVERALAQHDYEAKPLFLLGEDDLVGVYDANHGGGAWDKLERTQQADIFDAVKDGLGYGLGEWADAITEALHEAERPAGGDRNE